MNKIWEAILDISDKIRIKIKNHSSLHIYMVKNGVVSDLSIWTFRDCDEFVERVMGRFVIKRIWSTTQQSWQAKVVTKESRSHRPLRSSFSSPKQRRAREEFYKEKEKGYERQKRLRRLR